MSVTTEVVAGGVIMSVTDLRAEKTLSEIPEGSDPGQVRAWLEDLADASMSTMPGNDPPHPPGCSSKGPDDGDDDDQGNEDGQG